MGAENRLTFTAGATLTAELSANGERQLVALDTDGTIIAATTSSTKVVGALVADCTDGDIGVAVATNEIVKVRLAETIAAGVRVKVDNADANEVEAMDSSDDPNVIIGYLLQGGDANDVVDMKLLL